MIGIKTKNKLLESTLCHLYPDKIVPFQENQAFDILLCDDKTYKNEHMKIIYLGPKKQDDLQTPFSLQDLEKVLTKIQQTPLELTFFYWFADQRSLVDKATHKTYLLTQKEAELIDFLGCQPKHQATKEVLLSQVWHYHENTNTHTLNSHLYELNQKVGKNKLIRFRKNYYQLF